MSDDPLVSGTFNKWEAKIRPGAVVSGESAGVPAPDEVLKAFPMKDGRMATAENGYDDEKSIVIAIRASIVLLLFPVVNGL